MHRKKPLGGESSNARSPITKRQIEGHDEKQKQYQWHAIVFYTSAHLVTMISMGAASRARKDRTRAVSRARHQGSHLSGPRVLSVANGIQE